MKKNLILLFLIFNFFTSFSQILSRLDSIPGSKGAADNGYIIGNADSTVYYVGRTLSGSLAIKAYSDAAGTQILKDSISTDDEIYDFVSQGSNAFFIHYQTGKGIFSLYKSKGKKSNTKIISNKEPSLVRKYENDIIYADEDGFDNTINKYIISKDSIVKLNKFYFFGGVIDIAVSGSTIYTIAAAEDKTGRYLMSSQGQVGDIKKIKLINTGNEFNRNVFLTVTNDKIYFFWKTDVYQYGLWFSDGTANGTKPIAAFKEPSFQNLKSLNAIVGHNGLLYFQGEIPNQGQELWVSDGTLTGTKNLTDVDGSSDAKPRSLTLYKNKIYFTALNSWWNRELWSVSGTNTAQKVNLPNGYVGSQFKVYKDSLLIELESDNDGDELYISDGTTAGTKKLTNGNGNSPASFFIGTYAPANDKRIFLTAAKKAGTELWQYGPTVKTVVIAPLTTSIKQNGTIKCSKGTTEIEVITSGGESPYKYNWSASNLNGSKVTVAAGIYAVTVIDDGANVKVASITVTEPSEITVNANITSVDNATASNGKITPNVSGGTAPYQYAWSKGNGSNLTAGTYFLTVTDANGCTKVGQFVVGIALNTTIQQTATIKCNGDKTAALETTVSGGTSPYSYLWSTGSTSNNISNIGAGIYVVTISSVDGSFKTTNFEVKQPTKIQLTTSSTASAPQGKTGTATVLATGGTPAYTYSWNTTPVQTTATAKDLAIGTYTVTVKDANNCTAIANTTVNVGLGVNIEITATIKCNGDKTAALNANTLGGASPYTYKWNNGATTQSINNLGAGNYNVTITDKNGLTVAASKEITQPGKINLSLSSTNTTGSQKTGKVKVSINGGASPFTFIWNTGQTTQEITGLGEGAYSVTVTDANGCTGKGTVSVKNTISTNDFAEKIGLKIFPNPSSEIINIQFINQEIELQDYTITDLLGKVILNGKIQNNQINVSHLINGNYLLILQDKHQQKAVSNIVILK